MVASRYGVKWHLLEPDARNMVEIKKGQRLLLEVKTEDGDWPLSDSVGDQNSGSAEWACPQCTFHNKASVRACIMCGIRRVTATVGRSTSNGTRPHQTAGTTSTFERQYTAGNFSLRGDGTDVDAGADGDDESNGQRDDTGADAGAGAGDDNAGERDDTGEDADRQPAGASTGGVGSVRTVNVGAREPSSTDKAAAENLAAMLNLPLSKCLDALRFERGNADRAAEYVGCAVPVSVLVSVSVSVSVSVLVSVLVSVPVCVCV